jgi:hypothetical protein
VGRNCLPYRYTRSRAAGDDEVLAGAEPGDDELARCGVVEPLEHHREGIDGG